MSVVQMLERKVVAVPKKGRPSDHWALRRLKEQAKRHHDEMTSCRCQCDKIYTARFQIPNFPCQHPALFVDPTFPPLPSSDVNVGACGSPSHTPIDPAGSRTFKNEEPQHHEMRNLFLISEHKSVVLKLRDEVPVQRTRPELRITNAQKSDGVGLSFSVLCIDFGRSAQEAKRHEPARMRFDLQIRCCEKIGAVDKRATGRQ
jgi:hypothetical protein